MKLSNRAIYWNIYNLLLGVCAWVGTVYNSVGATRVTCFFVWLCALCLVFGATDPNERTRLREKGPTVPVSMMTLTDTIFLGLFLWHGWWITAAAQLMTIIAQQYLYSEEKP